MDDTVLSLSSLDFNEIEAFVELMFLAAWADGTLTDEERHAFRAQVFKGTAGMLDAKVVEPIIVSLEKGVAGSDRDAKLNTIRDRLRDPRKRHAALVHAARIVLADSVIALDEAAFLAQALAVLGEPADRVSDLLAEAREED